MARLVRRTAVVVGLGLGAGGSPALAQISPGKLARSHGSLEGPGQCLRCHDSGGVASEKCLSCHTSLRARVTAGKGLHARPTHRDCKACHIDHQGEGTELVWWGESGKDSFDHALTGYVLEGKHRGPTCAACHKPAFVTARELVTAQGVNAARTYLGLSRACLSCHADAHRGQFARRECASCHEMAGWKPAPRFEHGKTAYALTGKHVDVACAKCHPMVTRAGQGSFRQYQGIVSRECSSCHRDVHEGRLGAACASCHTTASWAARLAGRFDHERTQYSLRGKHVSVSCEACHAQGRTLRRPFARCTDCHTDTHLGQLARRADQGRCEACHDVSGFAPSTFLVDAHQKTAYPLAGAHLAVACNACHRPVDADVLRKVSGVVVAAGPGRKTSQLRFASFACADCHRDSHFGEMDRRAGGKGCAACHRVESWKQVPFDHATTPFPLTGGHAKPACAACHPRTDKGTPRERTQFAATPVLCSACHKDPHRGQLQRAASTACDGCHGIETWRRTRFDHARDAAFVLDGAHLPLACAACHVPEKAGALPARYKPLARTCKGCHGPAAGATGVR
jgi:hypothetical protein